MHKKLVKKNEGVSGFSEAASLVRHVTKTITIKQTAYELESLNGTNVLTDTRYKHRA